MGPPITVCLLGTGSSWPTPDRYHTSIGIQFQGEVILFDCGEACQIRMQQAKLSAMKVHNVFITHLHGDHFYGLPGLLYSLGMSQRSEPITVWGPKGIGDLKRFIEVGYCSLPFKVTFKEVEEGDVFRGDGYTIRAIKVNHDIPALAYGFFEDSWKRVNKSKIRGIRTGPWMQEILKGKTVTIQGKRLGPEIFDKVPGRTIVYSGDCRPSKRLAEFARGADVLIHEATYWEAEEEKANERAHSTTVGAAEVAKAAGVKKLILAHFSRKVEDVGVLAKEAKKIFPNTVAGKDLAKYTL